MTNLDISEASFLARMSVCSGNNLFHWNQQDPWIPSCHWDSLDSFNNYPGTSNFIKLIQLVYNNIGSAGLVAIIFYSKEVLANNINLQDPSRSTITIITLKHFHKCSVLQSNIDKRKCIRTTGLMTFGRVLEPHYFPRGLWKGCRTTPLPSWTLEGTRIRRLL